MKIKSAVISGIQRLSRIPDLSREANKRLKWFDHYYANGQNARLTCRYFGISPQTFYRWKRRYDPDHPSNLEDRSHRPRKVRTPTWSPAQALAVLKLREQYPRWGKEKLTVLLRLQGCEISVSMVGRILKKLKERGVLREPLTTCVSAGKRVRQRPYAVRKPKDYQISCIGDIVQLDTLDLRPLPGEVFKHFTAHDVVSKWNVTGVYRNATATTAASFLDCLKERMPFPVKAIQVDGGPEFQSLFEQACQERNIRLFVLPPRSPKLNGGVERAHRTHTEEFYEVTDCSFDLVELRDKLLEWENIYNTIRPHQSLHYLTPRQYLELQNLKE